MSMIQALKTKIVSVQPKISPLKTLEWEREEIVQGVAAIREKLAAAGQNLDAKRVCDHLRTYQKRHLSRPLKISSFLNSVLQ